MASQTEILNVVAVGEALTREQILDRLGTTRRQVVCNSLSRLRRSGQLDFVVVGERSRGGRVWPTDVCGNIV